MKDTSQLIGNVQPVAPVAPPTDTPAQSPEDTSALDFSVVQSATGRTSYSGKVEFAPITLPDKPTPDQVLYAQFLHWNKTFNALDDPEKAFRRFGRFIRGEHNYNALADPSFREFMTPDLKDAYDNASPKDRSALSLANTPQEGVRILEELKSEREQEDVIRRAGVGQNLLAATAAISTDPVNWALAAGADMLLPAVPGSIPLNTLGRTAGKALLTEGYSEMMLQNMQHTRSLAESALNIGAVTTLTPLVEGTILYRAHLKEAANDERVAAVHNLMVAMDGEKAQMDSVIAGGRTPEQDMTKFYSHEIAPLEKGEGKGYWRTNFANWSFNQMALGDVSPALQSALRQLLSTTEITTENVAGMRRGMARGGADAESQIRAVLDNTGAKKAANNIDSLYEQYVKRVTGTSTYLTDNPNILSLPEFRDEIGKAMRRNDMHRIAEVAQSAQEFRQVLANLGAEEQASFRIYSYDEMVEAFKAGKTADSYYRRVFDEAKVRADPEGLKRVIRKDILARAEPEEARRIAETIVDAKTGRTELDQTVDEIFTNATGQGRATGAARKGVKQNLKARKWEIRDELIEPWLKHDPLEVLIPAIQRRGTDAIMARFGEIDAELANKALAVDKVAQAALPDFATGSFVETEKQIEGLEAELTKFKEFRRGLADEVKSIREANMTAAAPEGGKTFSGELVKLPSILEDLNYANMTIENAEKAKALIERFRKIKTEYINMGQAAAARGMRMQPQIDAIHAHYDSLIEQKKGEAARLMQPVGSPKLPTENLTKAQLDAQAARAAQLVAEHTTKLNDMKALEEETLQRAMDYMLGRNGDPARVVRPVKKAMAVTSVGGMVVSQIGEVLSPFLYSGVRETLTPLMEAEKGIKRVLAPFSVASKEMNEIAQLVSVIEHASGSTMEQFAFGGGGAGLAPHIDTGRLRAIPPETIPQKIAAGTAKAVETGADVGATLTMADPFVHMQKSIAGTAEVMNVTRMAQTGWRNLTKLERAQLLVDGVDEATLKLWGSHIEKYGNMDGFPKPNIDAWRITPEGKKAADQFSAYILQKARVASNEPSAGAAPMWGMGAKENLPFLKHVFSQDTASGQLLNLFQQFAYQCHENVYRKLVQRIPIEASETTRQGMERAAKGAAYVAATTAIGALVGGTKRYMNGMTFLNRDKKTGEIDIWGTVRDGIENTNVATAFSKGDTMMELLSGHSLMTTLGAPRKYNLRDDPGVALGAWLGPTYSKAYRLQRGATALIKHEFDGRPIKRQDIRDLSSGIPYNNALLLTPFVQLMGDKLAKE